MVFFRELLGESYREISGVHCIHFFPTYYNEACYDEASPINLLSVQMLIQVNSK